MKKPAIGSPPSETPPTLAAYLVRVQENIETITGRRGGRVQPLAASASLDDVTAKLNEIISRLQG